MNIETDKPLPKMLPNVPQYKDGRNSLSGLQRFYDPLNHKRAPLDDKQLPLKEVELPNKGIAIHLPLKKILWNRDPLRLYLNREEEEKDNKKNQSVDMVFPFSQEVDLPYTFKPKDDNQEALSHPHVTADNNEEAALSHDLPFVTPSLFPPSPPARKQSSTPSLPPPTILPFESYASVYAEPSTWDAQDPSVTRLYEPGSPRHSASTLVDEKETWNAIFHPLSTFKHHKGELEYYAWNTTNLPEAAARVAQRVLHTHDEDREATLPQVMPTPPLKPSPVLTIEEEPQAAFPRCDSKSTMISHDYFDMLQQIRGHAVSASPVFKEDPEMKPPTTYWTEKRLFWVGFACPLLWYVGSIRKAQHPQWQNRCRYAALYFSIAISVVILVAAVKAAGSAAVRQSQTDTIRAVIAN